MQLCTIAASTERKQLHGCGHARTLLLAYARARSHGWLQCVQCELISFKGWTLEAGFWGRALGAFLKTKAPCVPASTCIPA